MKTVKCQHCHTDLQIQEEWLGMEADCPVCSKRTLLQEPLPQAAAASATVSISKKHLIIGGSLLGAIILILLICAIIPAKKEPEKVLPPAPQKTVAAVPKAEPAPQPAPKPAPKTEDDGYVDFGLQNMVSGIPKVVKPAEKFDIKKFIPQLNKPRYENRSYTLHVKYEEKEWIRAAEQEMCFSMRAGNCLDIARLLQLGYDINGSYTIDNSDSKRTPLELLFESFRIDEHNFIKTYIFLCENGVDLNKSFASRRLPYTALLNKCQGSKNREMWKLIPYSVAYGMNIDTTRLPRFLDPELIELVIKSANSKIKKPALKVENRLSDFKDQFRRLRVTPDAAKPRLEVINPVAENSLLICNHQTFHNRLKQDALLKLLKQGMNPNALLLCSSRMHGSGSYHEAITNFVLDDRETLMALLANNWKYGIEDFFKKKIVRYEDFKFIQMFWECGVDITPEMLNIVSDQDRWNFLKSLYDKQLCRFTAGEVSIRKEGEWSMLKARNAVMYNNFDDLQKIAAGTDDSNLDYNILFYMAAQRLKSEKIMQFCLDKGADPAWRDKNGTCAMDMALKYKHFDNAVFIYKQGKSDLPSDKLLTAFVSSVLHPQYRDSSVDQKLVFLKEHRQKKPDAFNALDETVSTKLFDRLVEFFSFRYNQKRAKEFIKAMDFFKSCNFHPSEKIVKKACASKYVKQHLQYLNSLLKK